MIPQPTRVIPIPQLQIAVPVFSRHDLPDGYCARYARFVNKSLFDVELPSLDAWDFRHHPYIQVKPLTQMQPGDIVGCYYSESRFNSPQRPYTHLAVYLGRRSAHFFAHYMGIQTLVSTKRELQELQLRPVEALSVR
jgi:hypothetical protein